MNSPIFVLGSPRSGTTMLRLMLNNHRNIVIPPECGFAIWFYEKYHSKEIDKTTIEHFIADLVHAKKIETWNLDFEMLRKYLMAKQPSVYAELVSHVYEFYGYSANRNFLRWGDKNNFYVRYIDIIKEMFPSSRLIHIVRDGRDVACSYKTINRSNIESKYAPHLPDTISAIASQWVDNLQAVIESFTKISWQQTYEIRYEDLTSESGTELKKLCIFLEESYDPEMEFYYLKNQAEQLEPPEFLQWKAKTLERATTSQVGRYKAELTVNEMEEFERIASSMLQRYNYRLER